MNFLYSFVTKKRIIPKKVVSCSQLEGNRHEIIAYFLNILLKVSVKKTQNRDHIFCFVLKENIQKHNQRLRLKAGRAAENGSSVKYLSVVFADHVKTNPSLFH